MISAENTHPLQKWSIPFYSTVHVPLDVVFRQILVYGRYVDAVVVFRLLCQTLNDGLSLGHVTRAPHLYVCQEQTLYSNSTFAHCNLRCDHFCILYNFFNLFFLAYV